MHVLTRIVTTLAVTATATVVLTGTASAALPKRYCNLLVDPVGDVTPVDSAQLDLRSGDIASGHTTVVGVLRLRSLLTNDPAAATGARWDLGFTVHGGARYTFQARRDALGMYSATFLRQAPGGTPAIVATPALLADVARGEIRWTVPRTAVPEIGPDVSYLPMYDLAADTFATPAEEPADAATAPHSAYRDGYPSCVRAV